eukprot:TRINITY_DN154_c0_g1_i8.p1 TRINITY_DN154_c0_g1~~TRINITY_DN154_c0_g1_i8.p1  ORF type:complete len:2005 (-),score=792.65 TRINITY_DN154_c0_g1_i8:106-6120(-)
MAWRQQQGSWAPQQQARQVAPPAWQQQRLQQQQPWQQQAAPVSAGIAQKVIPPAAAGFNASAAGPQTFVVATKGNDGDEIVIKTLVGEFAENGTNHGRKSYKKAAAGGGGEAVDVFMYYWDNRDGPTFEGWWFGNQVGGTQVWSHNASSSLTPPSAGWKIPWDGSVRATLSVESKAEMLKNEAQNKMQSIGGTVNNATNIARSTLEQAKAAAGAYTSAEGLRTAESLLQPQLTALAEAMKGLTDAGNNPALRGQVQTMRTQLQGLMSSINVELGKVRSAKVKADQNEKQKALEERDMVALQEILPEATQKTNLAEDAVEKAIITSEMIAAAGEDLEEVKQAVTQTEQAVQEAQKAMGEARIFLNAKQASSRRFESDAVKAKAAQEFGQLQTQLQAAQVKMNPLKNVRQDFVQRSAAKKMVGEILEKLSPAEVDVDRAEEATALVKESGATKEMLLQAQQAVTKAGDHLNTVMRFIEAKKKTSVGLAKEELEKMEQRAKGSQERLAKMKNSQKEATERVGLETLLKEAADKLQSVAESVGKAADAEGPFLMGVEELPLEETLAVVKAVETAATAANTATSIARMFLATKMVEAKRFTPELSKEAQTKLKQFQSELETHTKKLTELKKNTAERKKGVTMREAEHEVIKAEQLAEEVKTAASVLEDDEKIAELSSQEIRAASEKTIKAELAAAKQLAETRKFITARQIEAKGKEATSEVSQELIKYESRLRNVQNDIAKYKKLASSIDTRLAAKKTIEDAQNKIKAVEEKLAKVEKLAEAIDAPAAAAPAEGNAEQAEKTGPAAAKAGEQAAAEAQAVLKGAARFIDMQLRVQQGSAKEQIEKMKPRLDELQKQLDKTLASMRERSEKAVVDVIAKESEQRVSEAAESMKALKEAEKPFLPDAAELPAEKVSEALETLEKAVQAANAAVSGAKTFVGVKKLAARRLGEASKKAAEEQLAKVVARLEELAKSLQESKKNMGERKQSIVKREVQQKTDEAEEKVKAAEEATEALATVCKDAGEGEGEGEKKVEGDVQAPADEMKAACEKAGTAQQEARTLVTAAQKLLLSRQRDAKSANPDSELMKDITNHLERLSKMLSTLDKQKTLLRDQEHRFVAQRLRKDAMEQIEKLEKQLEATAEKASPLSDEAAMTAVVFLAHAVDKLKRELKKVSKTPKDLFAELSAGKGTMEEEAFMTKLKSFPEEGPEDVPLSDEQLKAAYKRMAGGKEDGKVDESQFLDEFRSRYLCSAAVTMTDGLVIKGGKTVRKVEVNEVMEGLNEPTKEETLGLMRINVKAEKDGKEGFVTVAGNQGTVYLEPYSKQSAFQKTVEQEFKAVHEACRDTTKYLESKVDELKAVRTGPLAETKSELLKLKSRVSKVQMSMQDIRKKAAQAEKKFGSVMEEEKKRRQEAADKKAAEALVEDVVQMVASAEEAMGKITTAAEGLIASNGSDQDKPLAAMQESEKSLTGAQETMASTMVKIKEQMESMKAQPAKGPYGEARNSLVKLKVKVGAMENKCKKLLTGLKTARNDLAKEAEEAVLNALRTHVAEKGVKADALFAELSKGEQDIPASALRAYLEKIPELKASQLDMAMERFASGLTKLTLLDLLQEFQKCIKEIALTTSLEVKDGKTVRKLVKGELVEVLEGTKVDSASSLPRIRCRALTDSKEGWVTTQGNQGSNFLEKASKPYYCCEADAVLSSEFSSGSSEVRKMEPGEVLEMLEGPKKEDPPEVLRMKGKASKDGKSGWVTLKDAAGKECFKLVKLLVCKQSIAITTTLDIAAGKAIRKLEVGEALDIVEGPQEDPAKSLSRVKVLAKKDGKEGWVTMQGNQGTSYVAESDKHYVCTSPVQLEKSFASGSTGVREIEEGEAFEALENPKSEKKEGIERVRGRTLSDGVQGWITLSSKSFTPWSPMYNCVQSTVLNDGLEIKDAKALRKLEPGEVLEALQSPILEKSAGLLRIRVRAKKDNVVGYATVRGNQGTLLLKPALGGEAEKPKPTPPKAPPAAKK